MNSERSVHHGYSVADLAFGVRHGAFDDVLGRSLLRASWAGATDAQIEGMIRHRVQYLRAQEAFGTLDPFPRPRLTHGDLILGADREGREIRIRRQWLVAGLLIAANTGGGKSFLLAWLALQLAAGGCRVWASDMYKTQVRHWKPLFEAHGADFLILRAADWRFNLLQPGRSDPRSHLTMVVDLLVRRLDLPPRARAILQQACYGLYKTFSIWEGRSDAYPCLFDLYQLVKSTTRVNAPARESILDRLGAFLTALTPRCGAYRLGWSPSDLARHSIDFEMRGTSETVKQVLLESTLYVTMRDQIDHGLVNAPIDLFVAFEDGQRFFDAQQRSSGEITPIDELAGVIRGSGKGLGVVVQTMQGMSSRLVPNLATKVMGRLGSHEDYARLGADLGMRANQVEWATRKLRPGVFIGQVSEGDWREPFIMSVPLLKIPPVVSDEEAVRSVQPLANLRTVPAEEFARWEPDHIIRIEAPPSGAARSRAGPANTEPAGRPDRRAHVRSDPLISKEMLDYVAAIAHAPLQTCTERDRELGIGASKGHRIRRLLIERGLVRLCAVNPGGRGQRFQLLEFTDKGREVLSAYGISPPRGHGRGGIAHQWWVQAIARWLASEGAACRIEDDSNGARVDLVASTSDGCTVAIEVETSPGHEVANVEKDIGAGYRNVVSLVLNPAAKRRAQTTLNGLLRGQSEAEIRVGCLRDYPRVLRTAIRSGLESAQDDGRNRSENKPHHRPEWPSDDPR